MRSLAVCVEHQLAQLGARGAAIAAEQGRQRGPRIFRDRQVRGAQLFVDQPREVARRIGVTGNRDRIPGALARVAQRGAALEIAGLDHDAAIAQADAEHGFHRRHDVAASGAHADRAPPAEQRNGRRLVDQPRRIGRERIAVETHQRERIVEVVDRCLDDRVDALADKAGVGTEHQYDGARRIGTGDERVDLARFQRDHAREIRCRRRRTTRGACGYFPRSLSRRGPRRRAAHARARSAAAARDNRTTRARRCGRSSRSCRSPARSA